MLIFFNFFILVYSTVVLPSVVNTSDNISKMFWQIFKKIWGIVYIYWRKPPLKFFFHLRFYASELYRILFIRALKVQLFNKICNSRLQDFVFVLLFRFSIKPNISWNFVSLWPFIDYVIDFVNCWRLPIVAYIYVIWSRG